MSLTFFLMLLLVIGIVLANIALLRFSNKPMAVPKKTSQLQIQRPLPAKPKRPRLAQSRLLLALRLNNKKR